MNRKESIYKTGLRLFSAQGYEATTTLQIAKAVGVTEPAVFYHFKNKNAFFSTILEKASEFYFRRIDDQQLSAPTAFESLDRLLRIHFSVVAENPEYMHILLRACPARLDNPDGPCTKIYRQARFKLKKVLTDILIRGTTSGEFNPVDIDATANMLLAMLNGIMHQQLASWDNLEGVESATIAFCNNALVRPGKAPKLEK
ncbi:TetR/AcrR family transcriptional regulator [uncultured Desulfosarcina sp.]|uniref:TetR/AcrR family transcriptional regulator n=1 Tax=uncultured Desulfosarcina sp. TaxID=218289 RepID=UPI0029C92E28|nr:TetR/AcrR family transcriptional regulator [uncultured Desulfosarcina sp.]